MGAFVKYRLSALALTLLLAGCATVPPLASGPAVAITIDDLPVHGPIPKGMTALDVNREMVGAISRARVRGVMGFVNGRWTEDDPTGTAALEIWRNAGIPLGNHTWSHKNINDLPVADYETEIRRNEPVLSGLAGASDWRWFRYPYLAEGQDPAKRDAIRAFLAARGYKIAGVTMSFSDWQFTAPYARCKDAGNAAAIAEMERLYLDAARDHLRYSRAVMRSAYGREVPLVLLMHVGAMSAHMMPRVIYLYRSMGVRFIPLAEAQADPAYAEELSPALAARTQSPPALAQRNGLTAQPPADNQARLDAMCQTIR
ncbi:MAG: polysaccharide deacetylase family protein [Sphingomicrobium sp.]